MRNYLLVAALVLSGLGTQLQALHSWNEAATPQFIGGFLLMGAGVVVAALSKPPGQQ